MLVGSAIQLNSEVHLRGRLTWKRQPVEIGKIGLLEGGGTSFSVSDRHGGLGLFCCATLPSAGCRFRNPRLSGATQTSDKAGVSRVVESKHTPLEVGFASAGVSTGHCPPRADLLQRTEGSGRLPHSSLLEAVP